MKKASSKINYVLFVCSLTAVFVLVAGFIAKFTNTFTSDFKTFYIELNETRITEDKNDILLGKNNQAKIIVGYSLGFLGKEKKGYNVKILPNVTKETDFEYAVNGTKFYFSELGDLTEYFEIEKFEDYFTIKATMNVLEILAKKHSVGVPEKPVEPTPTTPQLPTGLTGIDHLFESESNLLKLVISNADDSVKINLAFAVVKFVDAVKLSQTEIVF